MACICTSTPTKICTPTTVGGQEVCNCIESKPPVPCTGELVDLGNDTWVCRDTQTVATLECSEVSCDEANGFVYNPVTNKCEKTTITPACSPGFTYDPLSDPPCVPAPTTTPMCPPGYTYAPGSGNTPGTCSATTTSPATVTSTQACKADILLLVSPCYTPTRRQAFYDQLIANLTPGLDSGNIRFQYMDSSISNTGSSTTVRLLSGTGNFAGQPGGASGYFSRGVFNGSTCQINVGNSIAKKMLLAMLPLYVNDNIVNSGTLAPVRTNVKKIIIVLTDTPDYFASAPTPSSFGPCVSNDPTNFLNHYPTSYGDYTAMRYAVNSAQCLKNNYPTLRIFTVTDGNIGGSNWGGATGQNQYYTDIRNAGASPVYIINNTNGATIANQLYADILALPGTPAVCSQTNSYSCPPGCTLVNTNQCSCLTTVPTTVDCAAPCTISPPSGTSSNCVCSIPAPALCPPENIVDGECVNIESENPVISTIRTPISLDDPNYFEKIEWTVSYDPKNKMWLSFHDWHPSFMIPSYNHFFTIKDNSFWKHNERFDSFTNYYNVNDADPTKDYGWEVEYNIATPNQITTLRSIEYYMEAYKYYNDGKDMFHILDENFNRAIVYNSEQVSPLLSLTIKDKNNPLQPLQYPIVGPVNTQILASKEENKYRFNNFYDITLDRHEFPSANPIVPMFITAPNGYSKSINPAYIDVFKPATEHKKFRHFGNKIILRKTQSGDKKMLLKLVNSKMLNSPR
jgi:hypothetical protein